jgi:hypothetical protein
MWHQYAVGVATVVGVTAAWVAVQNAWKRAFPRAGCDPDALAVRGGCGGACGCVPRRVPSEEDPETPARGREETS